VLADIQGLKPCRNRQFKPENIVQPILTTNTELYCSDYQLKIAAQKLTQQYRKHILESRFSDAISLAEEMATVNMTFHGCSNPFLQSQCCKHSTSLKSFYAGFYRSQLLQISSTQFIDLAELPCWITRDRWYKQVESVECAMLEVTCPDPGTDFGSTFKVKLVWRPRITNQPHDYYCNLRLVHLEYQSFSCLDLDQESILECLQCL